MEIYFRNQIDILVCDLVKKFWSKDLEATKLRNLGNKLFQRGAVEESIAKYTEAIELGKYCDKFSAS